MKLKCKKNYDIHEERRCKLLFHSRVTILNNDVKKTNFSRNIYSNFTIMLRSFVLKIIHFNSGPSS